MRSAQPHQPVIDVSIVIPAYNEAHRIGATLDALAAYLQTHFTNERVEVIVVAADSADDTSAVAMAKAGQFEHFRLLQPGPKAGKGRDVQHGMLRARGKAVIFMDADLATPLSYLESFYEHHKNGHKVVIATRNLHKHHPNFFRRLVSNGGNLLFRIASGVWIEDSQCGFKMFTQQAARTCFSKLTILGWGFDMEVLAIARAAGLGIKTHRVDDWRSVPDGTFNEGMVKNSFASLRDLAYIFWNRLRGAYSE